jgi:hypothetical protein
VLRVFAVGGGGVVVVVVVVVVVILLLREEGQRDTWKRGANDYGGKVSG